MTDIEHRESSAIPYSDGEFQSWTLKKVEADDNGWTISDGWSLFVANTECKVAPQVGEVARLYGRGIGFPVRGIVIGGRVYRYETPAEHEVSQAAYIAKLTAEREESERKFRENRPSLPPLPKFALTDPEGWAKCVETNSSDPYSYECVRFAAAWAHEMQKHPNAVWEIAELCARAADTSGITGFMYGAAVSMLSQFWVRGEELRRWHRAVP